MLDLFAGSGAMGLEALSRGAASRGLRRDATATAIATIERNLEKLDLIGATVLRDDAAARLAAEAAAGRRYDLVLIDPPYAELAGLLPDLDRYLAAVLAPDGLVVVESDARDEPELPLPLRTSRRYGSARVTRLRGGRVSRDAHSPRSARARTTRSRTATSTSSGAPPTIFDRVVVGVVREPQHKEPLFTVEERVEFLEEALADLENVEVEVFSELVVDFARRIGATDDREGPPRHLGLRVGVPDAPPEPQPRAGGRDALPDVEPPVQLSFVERREGDRLVRRKRRGPRAAGGRASGSRTCIRPGSSRK